MAKNKVGRPTIMDQNVIDKLENAFAFGASDVEACLYADIAPATLYKYQDRVPEFVERKEALKQTPVLLARESVIKGLKNDPKLALAFLERKASSEFSMRTQMDHKVENIEELDDEQLQELAKTITSRAGKGSN